LPIRASAPLLITGEGSHQLTANDIDAMGRFGANAIVFVLNNDGYLIERSWEEDPIGPTTISRPWKYSELPKVPTSPRRHSDRARRFRLVPGLEWLSGALTSHSLGTLLGRRYPTLVGPPRSSSGMNQGPIRVLIERSIPPAAERSQPKLKPGMPGP